MNDMKNRIASTAAALALTASLVTPVIASAEENPAPINVAPSITGILKPSISTQAEGTTPASDYNTDPAPANQPTSEKKVIPLAPYGIPHKDITLGNTILRFPDPLKLAKKAVGFIADKIGFAIKGNDNLNSGLLG